MNKNDELRIKIAREGIASLGDDPDDIGGAISSASMKSEYAELIQWFNLLVADEPEITEATVAHARLRLREELSGLVEIARSLKGDAE
jgi:hypothetical protein